jgi:hypothetical protein
MLGLLELVAIGLSARSRSIRCSRKNMKFEYRSSFDWIA